MTTRRAITIGVASCLLTLPYLSKSTATRKAARIGHLGNADDSFVDEFRRRLRDTRRQLPLNVALGRQQAFGNFP